MVKVFLNNNLAVKKYVGIFAFALTIERIINNTKSININITISMKKILLTLATVVLSISINAQGFKHYSLNEVNGDTIQYLQKNFIYQKAYFIGKSFSKVMEVYLQDLPLKYSAKNTTSPWENPWDKTKYINGISITWFTVEEVWCYVYNYIKKKLFLFILFEPPYNEIGSDVAEKYNTDEKMVDHLKNYIVKDIKL